MFSSRPFRCCHKCSSPPTYQGIEPNDNSHTIKTQHHLFLALLNIWANLLRKFTNVLSLLGCTNPSASLCIICKSDLCQGLFNKFNIIAWSQKRIQISTLLLSEIWRLTYLSSYLSSDGSLAVNLQHPPHKTKQVIHMGLAIPDSSIKSGLLKSSTNRGQAAPV
jgi:hypothetical protein